jgi:hypothetical protein
MENILLFNESIELHTADIRMFYATYISRIHIHGTFHFYQIKNTFKPPLHILTCQCIANQRLDKRLAIRARNNRTNVVAGCEAAVSAPMDWRDSNHVTLFPMWSAPCQVLGNRTVNTFTIVGVFYAWSVPKVYRGQQRSFASSRSSGTMSQGHGAVMEKS